MAEEKNIDLEESAAVEDASVEETLAEEAVTEEAAVEEAPRQKSANVKQQGDDEPHWYVVHTYSGYE